MKQKIFLTSALAMGVIAPAFAEPSHTDSFPSDGYMQEDYTYTNAATAENMDTVYEGTVNAIAEYDTIDYILSAGEYLPADSETKTTCPAGSFCAGGDTVQYNQSSAQGIETCPSGFGSSADGSSSNNQCYRACDINNVGNSITAIAHATAISGNDYYGSGTDTCEPTACENGWHVKPAANLNDIIQGFDDGQVYGSGSNKKYRAISGATGDKRRSTDYSGLQLGEWSFEVNEGIVKGIAVCSSQSGSTLSTSETLQDSNGSNCWCKITSWTPVGEEEVFVESSYVKNPRNYASYSWDNNGTCLDTCAYLCANQQYGYSAEPAGRALFGAVAPFGLASCEANTITINWSDASQTDIDANNAGTATYGSDVRTPVKAQTIKGKTFKGWRFSKPEQTNLP